MMRYEDLSTFFGDSKTFEIHCNDKITFIAGQFARIKKEIGSENVLLYKVIDENDVFTSGYLPRQSDVFVLDESIRSYYFCRIEKVVAKVAHISILCFSKDYKSYDNETITIAIGDKAIEKNNYEVVARNILADYSIEIDGNKYYIRGKHKQSSDNLFSIVNSSSLFDVDLRIRGLLGYCDPNLYDDEIMAIISSQHNYKKDDYEMILCAWNIEFADISSLKFIKSDIALFTANDMDKYLTQWEKFSEFERDWLLEKANSGGVLKSNGNKDNGEEITFEIRNSTDDIQHFNQIARELSNNLPQINVSPVNGLKGIESWDFGLKAIRGNQIVLSKKGKREFKGLLPKDTTLSISTNGYEMQFARRKKAFELIESGEGGKPELSKLLQGEKTVDKKVLPILEKGKEILYEIFGDKGPTSNQWDAIQMALSTPDFAIIQGPPGTGKTTVIRAIQKFLSEFDKDKRIFFAKNIMSAYQNDATEHIVEELDIYGFPVKSFLGNKKETVKISHKVNSFIENMTENFMEKHPDVAEQSQTFDDIGVFENLRATYQKNKADYLTNQKFLKSIKKQAYNVINDYYLKSIDDLLEKCTVETGTEIIGDKNEILSCIRNLPVCEKAYCDNGKELATVYLYYLTEKGLDKKYNIETEITLLADEYKKDTVDFKKLYRLRLNILSKVNNELSDFIPDAILNSKIDNLLREISESFAEKMMETEQNILFNYLNILKNDKSQVENAIEKFSIVVGATHQQIEGEDFNEAALRINNEPLKFVDNIIIDEAARSCPPDLLIPMARATERIILVGDHKQLPQLINDEVLKKMDEEKLINSDLRVSMFEYLIEQCEKLKQKDGYNRYSILDTQYRMNKYLGDFISRNFYDTDTRKGIIKTGRDDKEFLHQLQGIENKCMVWLDVKGSEQKNRFSKSRFNEAEAKEIALRLKSFISSKEGKSFTYGVMTYYAEQRRELYKALFDCGITEKDDDAPNGYIIKDKYASQVEINTVDSFQGKQFDVVFLSLVRIIEFKNNNKASFSFLNDENRLCVALSRQKKCLIIVGDDNLIRQKGISPDALVDFHSCCEKGDHYATFIKWERTNI